MGNQVRVRLLGAITAFRDGLQIPLGQPRQRALFAVLAAEAGKVISREDIVEAVWGADPPVTVHSSIYTYVARLRRQLEPRRTSRAASRLLVTDSFGYQLQVEPDAVDMLCFARHLERARSLHAACRVESALAELEAGLGLWGGTAFGGADGPFATATRAQLDELRLMAQEQRAEILLELGRDTEVIADVSGLVRRFPLRERLRSLLMTAQARSGRQADALAEFRALRRELIMELGVEPAAELQRLHERILRGDTPWTLPVTPP